MCKNCDSVQVCRLNFQTMSEQSISFLRLKALCLAQEFGKIAEMKRHDLWLHVYFQLGCHLNHCNMSHCFLQLIFLTKWRTTQWVYDKTIAKSKFIQNTCSGSWFLCKEWKQFNLSEAMLGHHLCSTNHAVIVWESEAKFHYDTTENGWAFLDQLRSVDPSRYGLVVQKLCWYMLYSKILKARVRYILSDLFQLKNA